MLFGILPYIDRAAEFHTAMLHIENHRISEAIVSVGQIPIYRCPYDSDENVIGTCSYMVNIGLLDVIGQQNAFLKRRIRWSNVTDGLSQTGMISETVGGPSGLRLVQYSHVYNVNFPSIKTFPMNDDEVDAAADYCMDIYYAFPGSSSQVTRGRELILSRNSGYNHVLTPNSPSCYSSRPPFQLYPPGSLHRGGGVMVLMADGSVRFVSETIDREIWQAIGSIDGQETVHDGF